MSDRRSRKTGSWWSLPRSKTTPPSPDATVSLSVRSKHDSHVQKGNKAPTPREDLLPFVYAVFMLFIAPAIAIVFFPLAWLRLVHWMVSVCYALAAAWVLSETLAAVISTIHLNCNDPDLRAYQIAPGERRADAAPISSEAPGADLRRAELREPSGEVMEVGADSTAREPAAVRHTGRHSPVDPSPSPEHIHITEEPSFERTTASTEGYVPNFATSTWIRPPNPMAPSSESFPTTSPDAQASTNRLASVSHDVSMEGRGSSGTRMTSPSHAYVPQPLEPSGDVPWEQPAAAAPSLPTLDIGGSSHSVQQPTGGLSGTASVASSATTAHGAGAPRGPSSRVPDSGPLLNGTAARGGVSGPLPLSSVAVRGPNMPLGRSSAGPVSGSIPISSMAVQGSGPLAGSSSGIQDSGSPGVSTTAIQGSGPLAGSSSTTPLSGPLPISSTAVHGASALRGTSGAARVSGPAPSSSTVGGSGLLPSGSVASSTRAVQGSGPIGEAKLDVQRGTHAYSTVDTPITPNTARLPSKTSLTLTCPAILADVQACSASPLAQTSHPPGALVSPKAVQAPQQPAESERSQHRRPPLLKVDVDGNHLPSHSPAKQCLTATPRAAPECCTRFVHPMSPDRALTPTLQSPNKSGAPSPCSLPGQHSPHKPFTAEHSPSAAHDPRDRWHGAGPDCTTSRHASPVPLRSLTLLTPGVLTGVGDELAATDSLAIDSPATSGGVSHSASSSLNPLGSSDVHPESPAATDAAQGSSGSSRHRQASASLKYSLPAAQLHDNRAADASPAATAISCPASLMIDRSAVTPRLAAPLDADYSTPQASEQAGTTAARGDPSGSPTEQRSSGPAPPAKGFTDAAIQTEPNGAAGPVAEADVQQPLLVDRPPAAALGSTSSARAAGPRAAPRPADASVTVSVSARQRKPGPTRARPPSGPAAQRGAAVELPTVSYIVPTFLDNEAGIINETLATYTALNYRGRVEVIIVFNSARATHEQERGLLDTWHNVSHDGIHFRAFKNHRSRSKAANVNYGLDRVSECSKYVAIMDADHHPVPEHAARVAAVMASRPIDVLQGSCTIRPAGCLSKLVAVEFEGMYNVGHRGRLAMFDVGIFGGSNGVWKRQLLQGIRMDPGMLTEDIDSTMRAVLEGARFGYDSRLISSEQAPDTEWGLRRQRLRWTQGWSQVTWRYTQNVLTDWDLSLRQKVGYSLLLIWRETFVYFTFHTIILVVGYGSRAGFNTLSIDILFLFVFVSVVSVGPVRVLVSWALAAGPIRYDGVFFFLFLAIHIPWLIYMNFLHVMGHARILLGLNSWVATKRAVSSDSEPSSSAHSSTGLHDFDVLDPIKEDPDPGDARPLPPAAKRPPEEPLPGAGGRGREFEKLPSEELSGDLGAPEELQEASPVPRPGAHPGYPRPLLPPQRPPSGVPPRQAGARPTSGGARPQPPARVPEIRVMDAFGRDEDFEARGGRSPRSDTGSSVPSRAPGGAHAAGDGDGQDAFDRMLQNMFNPDQGNGAGRWRPGQLPPRPRSLGSSIALDSLDDIRAPGSEEGLGDVGQAGPLAAMASRTRSRSLSLRVTDHGSPPQSAQGPPAQGASSPSLAGIVQSMVRRASGGRSRELRLLPVQEAARPEPDSSVRAYGASVPGWTMYASSSSSSTAGREVHLMPAQEHTRSEPDQYVRATGSDHGWTVYPRYP